MVPLPGLYSAEGKYAQAEALSAQALKTSRRVLGPEHPRTLTIATTLAEVYRDSGKYAEAEALYGQTLEIKRRVVGPEQPITGLGHISMTFGAWTFFQTIRDRLIYAAVILSVAVLPYLVWRLKRARSLFA